MFHLTGDTPSDRICGRSRSDKPAIRARLSARALFIGVFRRNFFRDDNILNTPSYNAYRELSTFVGTRRRNRRCAAFCRPLFDREPTERTNRFASREIVSTASLSKHEFQQFYFFVHCV